MNPGVDEWVRQAGTQIKHFFGSRPVGKERDLLKEKRLEGTVLALFVFSV